MHHEPQPRPARARFVRFAAELFHAQSRTYTKLGELINSDRTTVSAALKGHQNAKPKALPARDVIERLDMVMEAGGRLMSLWQDAMLEDTAIHIKFRPAGLGDTPWRTVDGTREVSPTNRRQLFERMGGLTAASVLAVTDDVDGQLRAAKPKISSLADADTALATLNRDRCSVDPAILFPPAYEAWQSVEDMLARRVRPDYVQRLTLLAGQLAAGLSGVATFGGDERFGRIFAGIAEEHATAANEPLLLARVAGLQSWQAADSGQVTLAADIAARGRQAAKPPDWSRLAAYEAEAASLAGDHDRADAAIRIMLDGKQAAEKGESALPWDDVEENVYLALTAARTPGRGQVAILHGALAAQCPCPCQGVGLAHVAIARGHLDGKQAPDAAAAAGLAAMDTVAAVPNLTVQADVRDLVRDLIRWRSEPLVRELAGRVAVV